MAEKSFWSYIRQGMKGRWEHVIRHENMISIGVADVSYYLDGNGWIELKNVKQLPKRTSTGINLGQWHMNGGAQRYFLIKRHGWLLVRVLRPHRAYLLFKWEDLPPWERPYWTWAEMKKHSYWVWVGSIEFSELKIMLRSHK